MIIQIPTNYNSRHLADSAYKASEDYNRGRITKVEAYQRFDLYGEVLDRLIRRETPTEIRGIK